MISLPCAKQTTNLQVNKALQSDVVMPCKSVDNKTMPFRGELKRRTTTITMLFEWMKHRRPATVGFIIFYLTCLDLSWAYSSLCHSRRWDVMFDVFADLATTFFLHSLQVGSPSSLIIHSDFLGSQKTPKQKNGVAWPEIWGRSSPPISAT